MKRRQFLSSVSVASLASVGFTSLTAASTLDSRADPVKGTLPSDQVPHVGVGAIPDENSTVPVGRWILHDNGWLFGDEFTEANAFFLNNIRNIFTIGSKEFVLDSVEDWNHYPDDPDGYTALFEYPTPPKRPGTTYTMDWDLELASGVEYDDFSDPDQVEFLVNLLNDIFSNEIEILTSDLPSKISHYTANVGDAGSSGFGENFIRSPKPFNHRQFDSGRVQHVPSKRGVKLRIDDGPNDTQPESVGFYIEVGRLQEMFGVNFYVDGHRRFTPEDEIIQANLWFDIDGDGDFFTWREGRGSKERVWSVSPDKVAFGGFVSNNIKAHTHEFSGRSIVEWKRHFRSEEQLPDNPRVALWVGYWDADGGIERQVQDVSIETR